MHHLGALGADVEELGDHRERDGVGDLLHNVDWLAGGERLDRGLHDRPHPIADALNRARGEEPVDRSPQSRVLRRVRREKRPSEQLGARSGPAQRSEELLVPAQVRAPLGPRQDRARVLVRQDEMRAAV